MKKVLILILAMVLSFSVFALAACQTPCETHVDANHDGICDVCATANLPVVHADSNHDGKCDICAADYREACADVNPLDGKCDVCGADVAHTCVDTATVDGKCDICGAAVAHTCVDTAKVDGKCDICGADVAHTHVDAMHDGKCDICGTTVEVKHVDNNHDGVCDVCQVGDLPYEHVDEDTNFKCDVCDKVLEHDCVDANTDCLCDVCEAAMHVDANHDDWCDNCEVDMPGEPEHKYVEGVCSCGLKEAWLVNLESAYEYLRSSYIEDPEATTVDYKVVATVSIDGAGEYTVTWTVEILELTEANKNAVKVGETAKDDNDQLLTTIDVDEFCLSDVSYKLIATISDADGHTTTVSFDRRVPMFKEATWEEYREACEAKDGETIISVKAYVTAVNADPESTSTGSLWAKDADGHGYYAYKPSLDKSITESRESILATFPVGAEVIITGTVSNQYGTCQHSAGCTILVTGNMAPEGWNNEPVDQTEAFSNAEHGKDVANLEQYFATMVTLKGVTMGSVNGLNHYFTLNGVQYIFYQNIYLMDEEASNAIGDKWVVGGKANVTGLVTTYSGQFQIYPFSVDCLEIVKEELTDAQIVERAKDALSVDPYVMKAGETTLPASIDGYDVAITWSLAEGKTYDFATLTDGKLVVANLPEKDTVVELVATITKGDASDTKAISITVKSPAFDIISFAEATELAGTTKDVYTEDKYYMIGTIKEVTNTKYGNMTIVDDKGNEFTLYGTYDATGANRYDAIENAPVAGDVVVVYGTLGYYNAPQMKNGWIVASYDVKTFAEATELAGTTKDVYTEDKYYMIGTIKEVTNTKYGNMTIVDDKGNEFTVYGTYDATGANRYDAIENAPVAGEVVVVYGILGYYNAPQMKNGWIVAVAPAGEGGTDTPVEPPVTDDPAADSVLTIEQALTLGASKAHNTYTTGKYYVTGVITEVYNTQYGNMYIKDEAGNILTIYGTYDATGANSYSAMATKPVAGDTVKIYGIIGQYNDTPQLKNGWIVEHTPAEGTDTPVEPPVTDDPAADSVLTIEQALTLGASKAHNTYTTGKYYVTGVITEVYNTQYGNMYIKDEAGNILTIYGTYDATGANSYSAMATKPVAGDTVKIYGIIGQYNDTPQLKNGWIVDHTPAEGTDTPVEDDATASIDVTKAENLNGTPSGEKISFAKDGLTVTIDKADSSNALSDQTSKGYAARVYKGATLTVAYSKMTKIVITCDSYESYGNTYYSGFDGIEVAGATITREGVVVTIVLASPVDTFTAAPSSQVRIMSVKVYADGESEPITPPTPVHTCESVCEICKKCLDAECEEAACADKCEGHEPAVVLEDVVVNVSDLTAETISANKVLAEGSVTLLATENKTVIIETKDAKEIDGFSFTNRMKLGGGMGDDYRALKLEVQGPCTVVLYAVSSSSDAGNERVLLIKDSTHTTIDQKDIGLALHKVEIEISEAGTYYLGSEDSGINIYYIAIDYTAE